MKLGLFTSSGEPLFPPIELAALRMTIAGLTLLPISLRHFKGVSRDQWKWIATVGFVGSLIPAMLFATAQTHLPSAMAGMLNALSPLWTLLIGVLIFGAPLRKNQIIGIILGLLGTAWLIRAQNMHGASISEVEQEAQFIVPSLMLVLATVCYGVSVNVTREKLQGLRSPLIAACSLGLIAIPSSIILVSGEVPHLILTHEDGMKGLGAVVVLAAIGTAGALVLFNQLIAWTNAVTAASVTYIIPVFAAMWGWWDGEVLTVQHLMAGGCILLGVWITNRGRKR